MEKIELQAFTRTVEGKKVKTIRQKGRVPGVVYGQKIKSSSVEFDRGELSQVLEKAGSSSLVQLSLGEDKPLNILLQEPQRHPISGDIIHIDCFAVRMDEKIETEIPLSFVGAAPAVDELEGNLVTSKEEISVRCLPADLVPEIIVDLSILKTFDDSIRISDLNLPPSIEVLHDPEEVVVSVSEPISEEELADLDTDTLETEAAAVEELGKEDTQESAEDKIEE